MDKMIKLLYRKNPDKKAFEKLFWATYMLAFYVAYSSIPSFKGWLKKNLLRSNVIPF